MYFISPEIYIKHGGPKGMGIYAKNNIPANTMLEISPVSRCWKSTWEGTTYHLKKIVFSYPANSGNYAIALGYIAIYNHDDDNNAHRFTSDVGVFVVTKRDILEDEEICINYVEDYWKNGWTKI